MKKKGEIKENTISKNYRGQVWVETVIYLLIAFVMMGLVLSFIKPKIEELRDKAIIDQSIEIIKEIDNSIATIGSPGNKRLIELGVRKGEFTIDTEHDLVIFEMATKYAYSESEEPVYVGQIKTITQGKNQNAKVRLERNFSLEYNFIYNDQDINKTLAKASTPYKLFIENKGPLNDKILINFNVE